MRDWLKTLRCNNGYTQQAIAKKINITQQYYQKIENGERQKQLSLALVIKLAEIFGVSVEWIAEQEKHCERSV